MSLIHRGYALIDARQGNRMTRTFPFFVHCSQCGNRLEFLCENKSLMGSIRTMPACPPHSSISNCLMANVCLVRFPDGFEASLVRLLNSLPRGQRWLSVCGRERERIRSGFDARVQW